MISDVTSDEAARLYQEMTSLDNCVAPPMAAIIGAGFVREHFSDVITIPKYIPDGATLIITRGGNIEVMIDA